MSNVYLFTGENDYELRKERTRWITEFARKYGEENRSSLDGSSVSLRELLDEAAVQPFLAEKRLIAVFGVPRADKEQMRAFLQGIHPSVIVLFSDPKPDKRTSGVKELIAQADVKEFAMLKGQQLTRWAESCAASLGLAFAQGAMEALIGHTGNDQGMLENELHKLALRGLGRAVTRADIEENVIPSDEGVIWTISDLLSSGATGNALLYARRMLERGGDAYGLWAVLLNMLKNLAAVSAAMDAGYRSGRELADASGVHPFALRSVQAHVRRMKKNEIVPFLVWAAGADHDLKTGAYRSSEEAPQELRALIDRFILACP